MSRVGGAPGHLAHQQALSVMLLQLNEAVGTHRTCSREGLSAHAPHNEPIPEGHEEAADGEQHEDPDADADGHHLPLG